MQAEAGQGIESRRSVREFNIGMGEKADAELRRTQAELNRNAAIQGMFGFAGSALKSASKIAPLYGKKKSKAPTAPEANTEWQNHLISNNNQQPVNPNQFYLK